MHTRMRLGELLLASGLLSADQLEAALQGQRSSGMKLGEYLIKQGICRESDVVDAVCRQTGIERYTPCLLYTSSDDTTTAGCFQHAAEAFAYLSLIHIFCISVYTLSQRNTFFP